MEKTMVEASLENSRNQDQEEERKKLAAREFAKEVRRLRNNAGLSQAALGSLIGVEQTIIARIEKAAYGVDLDLVLNLAAAFHDNPHRLANIYWGIDTEKYVNESRVILDSIWNIIYPFYRPEVHSTSTNPPIPPTNAQAEKGLKEAKEIHAAKKKSERTAANKKAGVEPPLIGNGESQDGGKSNPQ